MPLSNTGAARLAESATRPPLDDDRVTGWASPTRTLLPTAIERLGAAASKLRAARFTAARSALSAAITGPSPDHWPCPNARPFRSAVKPARWKATGPDAAAVSLDNFRSDAVADCTVPVMARDAANRSPPLRVQIMSVALASTPSAPNCAAPICPDGARRAPPPRPATTRSVSPPLASPSNAADNSVPVRRRSAIESVRPASVARAVTAPSIRCLARSG